MPIPSDASVLAAGFTLGCMLIHACRRKAALLTAFLLLVIAVLSLLVLVLVIDRSNVGTAWAASTSETSERTYGFE